MPIVLLHPWYLLIWLAVPLIWLISMPPAGKSRFTADRPAINGLRGVVLLLIVLALADPRLKKGSDNVNLFFCLDASRSMGQDQIADALSLVRRIASTMTPEDRAGLIVFGRAAQVETGLTGDFNPTIVESQVDADGTNVYDALQLALGRLPSGEVNRIVLLSDGNENIGEALKMAQSARTLNTAIFPVPMGAWFDRDLLAADQLVTPDAIALQTPFTISLIISSIRAVSAELTLYRNDRLLLLKTISLQPGKNILHFSDRLEEQGLYLYKALVQTAEDGLTENNVQLSFTRATAKSRVLYLSAGDGRPAAPFARALESQGLDLQYYAAGSVELNLRRLADYSAVIIDNVPARLFPMAFMEDLSNYVKEMGGGLIMLGGNDAFGAGRYAGTAVEDALPVNMDVPAQKGTPGFGLLLLVDKSASMSGGITAAVKIETAKKAAFSSVEMLNPTDLVGILAFDTRPQWVVPMVEAGERAAIARKLSTLKADGGTDLFEALSEGYRVLNSMDLAKKHMIVLSDGLTLSADFAGLVEKIKADRISVSTVALGEDADIALMEAIAAWGGGRSYHARDVENVPRIFAGETSLAIRDVIREGEIQITPGNATMEGEELLKGLPMQEIPSVNGLVVTYPKPGAHVLLDSASGPLLVVRNDGLGRSVAYTSDLGTRWGTRWVAWPYFGRFAAQMVRWAQRRTTTSDFNVRVFRHNGRAEIQVDVREKTGRFADDLHLDLNVLMPSTGTQHEHLEQIGPGLYSGIFQAAETGAYYLTLYTDRKNSDKSVRLCGYAVSYSDEFAKRTIDREFLERLGQVSGGRMISPDDLPVDMFSAPASRRQYGPVLWPFLVFLSILLFVGEIGIRKVMQHLQY